jgi:phosphohistidine phosphatase
VVLEYGRAGTNGGEMVLYLMQHGEARSKEEDRDRSLSPEGQTHAQWAGRALAALGVKPTLIVTSPKKRAAQTGKAVAEGLGLGEAALRELPELAPTTPPNELMAALPARESDAILLAGHLPSLADLADYLLGSRVGIAFQNAGIVALGIDEWKPAGARLLWYLLPEHMEKIAKE